MLCKRVIAAVLIADGNVVQTRQFKVTNVVGKVETAVKFFAAWDADEIMLIDISREPWPDMLKTVEAVTRDVFVPVTVGGHIRTMQQVRDVFNAGGDKVLIRRAACEKPELIENIYLKCGAQALCVCLDHANFTWVHAPIRIKVNWVGEYVLNDQSRDGTKTGFNIPVINSMATTRAIDVPIIAMGGCGKPEHAVEAIQAGADAVAIGNMLHYSEHAVVKAKRAIKAAGFSVRESNLAVL